MNAAESAPAGTQLVIEYDDHNDLFESQLPRRATVIRRLSAHSGVDDWYLVALDRPVAWDGASYGHLLVRSRWVGHRLGDPDATSVFMLLVSDANAVGSGPINVERYYHVAWGMARPG